MRTIVLAFIVSSAAAFGVACGSSPEGNAPDASPGQEHADGAAGDSGADGADGNQVPFDAGADCGYPDVHNDPQCPATYHYDYQCQPCSPVGLSCAYPGAGDGTSNGCFATAGLTCMAVDAGVGGCSGDAGDAGVGHWVATQ